MDHGGGGSPDGDGIPGLTSSFTRPSSKIGARSCRRPFPRAVRGPSSGERRFVERLGLAAGPPRARRTLRGPVLLLAVLKLVQSRVDRSEERRIGKEWRARWR